MRADTIERKITLIVDDKEIQAEEGITVLQACLDNGIYIPNLCWLKEMQDPPVSCRLCFVHIEGIHKPVPSCIERVREGMRVRTDTELVRRLQRTALQLIFSAHPVEYGACPANKRCELQRMARFLKVGFKSKRLQRLERKIEVPQDHPFLEYDAKRCVLCGKCVYMCGERQEFSLVTFAKRGFDTTIRFSPEFPGEKLPCPECQACIEVCPVRAILPKEALKEVG